MSKNKALKIVQQKELNGTLLLITVKKYSTVSFTILRKFNISRPTTMLKWLTIWKPQPNSVRHPLFREGDYVFIKTGDVTLDHYEKMDDLNKAMTSLSFVMDKNLIHFLNSKLTKNK